MVINLILLFLLKKLYLRTIRLEANIEEDIYLKNQYRIKDLPDPISIRDDCTKNWADNLFNDPSIIKNTVHANFNDKDLNNVRFIKVNSMPTLEEHLTTKLYVDQALCDGVENSSLLR